MKYTLTIALKLECILIPSNQIYPVSNAKMTKTWQKNTCTENNQPSIIRKISPLTPPSPPASNLSTNDNRNGGDTPSDSGDNTSTTDKVSPPREQGYDAHFERSGDIGGSGDTFRLSLGCDNSTDIIQLDGKDYVAFDLE